MERAPGTCPICLTHPLKQIAPQLWDCTSRRCNSQFYVDHEGLLAVRDRIPREAGLFGRKPYRCNQEQLANRRAAVAFLILGAAALGASLGANQPVLALAGMIFIVSGVLIAKDA